MPTATTFHKLLICFLRWRRERCFIRAHFTRSCTGTTASTCFYFIDLCLAVGELGITLLVQFCNFLRNLLFVSGKGALKHRCHLSDCCFSGCCQYLLHLSKEREPEGLNRSDGFNSIHEDLTQIEELHANLILNNAGQDEKKFE